MLLTKMTTVTELLSSGAFVEGSRGESLTQMMSVISIDREWIHDLPLVSLLKKGAVVSLKSGLSLHRYGDNVALHDDFDNEIISVFEMTDEGFAELSEAIFMADLSPELYAHFAQNTPVFA